MCQSVESNVINAIGILLGWRLNAKKYDITAPILQYRTIISKNDNIECYTLLRWIGTKYEINKDFKSNYDVSLPFLDITTCKGTSSICFFKFPLSDPLSDAWG